MDANKDVGSWLTAEEIAEMRLGGGVPGSERRVHDYAARHGWQVRHVPSAGRSGTRREYLLPAEVQARIDARRGAEAAAEETAGPELADEGTSDAGLLRSPPKPEYAVNRAFRGGVVDAELLARVAIACSVVHGRAFDQVVLPHQVQAAAEAYNVLLSFASHLPGGPEALRQLDQEALVAQLRLLIQLGALKPWTPA